MLEVARGLEYLHSRFPPIVHFDIRPVSGRSSRVRPSLSYLISTPYGYRTLALRNSPSSILGPYTCLITPKAHSRMTLKARVVRIGIDLTRILQPSHAPGTTYTASPCSRMRCAMKTRVFNTDTHTLADRSGLVTSLSPMFQRTGSTPRNDLRARPRRW